MASSYVGGGGSELDGCGLLAEGLDIRASYEGGNVALEAVLGTCPLYDCSWTVAKS